jgi:hypothetical protein
VVRAAVALVLAVAAGALAATASGTASPEVLKLFRTPSGNIGCVYGAQGKQSTVRCDIRTGLKPKPARPKGCDLDYGDSYQLAKTGRAILVCHGDTAIDPHAPVLAYGKTFHGVGITCTSRTTGLRCANPGGHGFFLSRAHSYRF